MCVKQVQDNSSLLKFPKFNSIDQINWLVAKHCELCINSIEKKTHEADEHGAHDGYSLSLIIIPPLGSGCPRPGVGVSVSLTAATAAKDGQPGGCESSRAALPVILGAAGRAPQRERRPGARLLQCPA